MNNFWTLDYTHPLTDTREIKRFKCKKDNVIGTKKAM